MELMALEIRVLLQVKYRARLFEEPVFLFFSRNGGEDVENCLIIASQIRDGGVEGAVFFVLV